LNKAEQQVVACYGPRRLVKLIEDRRKRGLLLPFRVKLARNCRVAQVVQWIAQNPDDPLDPQNISPFLSNSPFEKDGVETEYDQAGFYGYDEYGQPLTPTVGIDYQPTNSDSQQQFDDYLGGGQFKDLAGMGMPEEGAWSKLLKTGDFIYLQGQKFKICPALVAKKKLKSNSRRGSASSSRPSTAGSTGSDHSGEESGEDSRRPGSSRRSKSSKRNVSDDEFDDMVDDGNLDRTSSAKSGTSKKTGLSSKSGKSVGSDSSNDPFAKSAKYNPNFELEIRIETTLDHITLNRPWLFEDAELVDVYKVMPRVFFMKPVIAFKDIVLKTYPIQKSSAILAITMHKIAKSCEYLITFFDEESPKRKTLGNIAHRTMRAKNYWLSFSFSIVQMSFDFSVRRQLGRVAMTLWKLVSTTLRMCYSTYKTLTSHVKETPFEFWNRSLQKEAVLCFLALSTENVVKLGEIRVDLNAPLEIVREYYCRNFRVVLNETVGESFLFLKSDPEGNSSKDLIAHRDDEFRIPGKDYCLVITDKKTFVSQPSLTVCKDRERGRVFIQEYSDVVTNNDMPNDNDEDVDVDDLL
jgi:hypothetical protein